jgi:hypothetical protein
MIKDYLGLTFAFSKKARKGNVSFLIKLFLVFLFTKSTRLVTFSFVNKRNLYVLIVFSLRPKFQQFRDSFTSTK